MSECKVLPQISLPHVSSPVPVVLGVWLCEHPSPVGQRAASTLPCQASTQASWAGGVWGLRASLTASPQGTSWGSGSACCRA